MKKLFIFLILLFLLPLVYADSCEDAKNPDLCYFVQAKKNSDSTICSSISDPSLQSQCELQFFSQTKTSSLGMVIIVLIVLFVVGLILAFYWMWHKAHITKTKRLKNVKHPQLIHYIHKARKQGMSKRQIRQELKKEGWPDDIINQYL